MNGFLNRGKGIVMFQFVVNWMLQYFIQMLKMIVKHALVLGVPSAYQQKRIKELNSTLQREQLEVLQFKDRMIMVRVSLSPF